MVLYRQNAAPADAAASVGNAGGTIVESYPQIGVVVARSDVPRLRLTSARTFGSRAPPRPPAWGSDWVRTPPPSIRPRPVIEAGAPAPGNDSPCGLQWAMAQIKAPEARAINGGSRSILVGDIDTGLDYTHPDLAANVDDAASANGVRGVAVPGKVAAMDDKATGRTLSAPSQRPRTDSESSASHPTCASRGSRPATPPDSFPEAVICVFM